MICCLCAEPILLGDAWIVISQHRTVTNLATGKTVVQNLPLEDGSQMKVAHSLCPAKFGAPLALIGAELGRIDG